MKQRTFWHTESAWYWKNSARAWLFFPTLAVTGALYDKMVAGLRAESKVYPIFSDQRQNS